jgi:hypothetical protein
MERHYRSCVGSFRPSLYLIHTFPYGRHIQGRPFLPCDIIANGRTHNTFAIVDSGADMCFFPLFMALDLGFEPRGRNTEIMRGLTGVASFYRWEVTLEFSFGSFRLDAGFGESVTSAVPGQIGFFDQVRVMFDRKGRIFTIEPH